MWWTQSKNFQNYTVTAEHIVTGCQTFEETLMIATILKSECISTTHYYIHFLPVTSSWGLIICDTPPKTMIVDPKST